MALEDFILGSRNDNTYYWYYKIGNVDSIITDQGFGTGKENTRKMIEKWNATGTNTGYQNSEKNDYDIWNHIQTKYQEGWYIPSKEEWAAFADYLRNRKNNPLIENNYNNIYQLSETYWTSSQEISNYVYYIDFEFDIDYTPSFYWHNIRFGFTF